MIEELESRFEIHVSSNTDNHQYIFSSTKRKEDLQIMTELLADFLEERNCPLEYAENIVRCLREQGIDI